MVGMVRAVFPGFTKDIFDSCETGTDKINHVRDRLEQLKDATEPKMQRLDNRLHGIVSRPKRQGTNDYTDWAWLMFTIAPLAKSGPRKGKPLRANKLSQLTVNVSRDYLYVGLNLKRSKDVWSLHDKLKSNPVLFDDIVLSLGSMPWDITKYEENFGEPKYRDKSELRVALLDPEFDWINTGFARDDPVVGTSKIADEVVKVFSALFNIYALATGLQPTKQPKPSGKPWKMRVETDTANKRVETDEELIQDVKKMMASVAHGKPPKKANFKGKNDRHTIERKVRPLNLTAHTHQGRSYHLDQGHVEKELETRLKLYDEFRDLLDRISSSIEAPKDFLQIMLTDPTSDARYTSEGSYIFANLLRYEVNRSEYFWLTTVAREVAYLKRRRLGYAHQNWMRKVLVTGLTNWPSKS